MEIGNQIKTLRGQRGVTQETVAAALGVLPQTVSKWETGATAPDIALLPAISAYFGVTIDELFALTDEQRVERIRNMLWDNRDIEEAALDREAQFLQDKTRREPEKGEALMMLAWIENFKASAHRRRAAYYARQSLEREPDNRDAHGELREAMDVACTDWYSDTHTEYIDWYKDFIAKNPTVWRAYMYLTDALVQDRRFDEAEAWCDQLGEVDHTFRTPDCRARVAWARGDRERAAAIWEQMCRDFPDEWMAWACRGDGLAAEGEYERAIECYREAQRHQTHPRALTDPYMAIAQLYERMGDIPAAIAANEELIAALRDDWDITQGESVDEVRREIERLKKKL